MSGYLLAGQASELERLQLQSRVWEPAGRALLAKLPGGAGRSALDCGCGVLGWLRVLSEWVGPAGRVTGSDIDEKMLGNARAFVEAEKLGNVKLAKDDLFASALPARGYDLVHARFQIAPLGHAAEQMRAYLGWLRPGGHLVVEDPDMGSWHLNPPAPSAERLIELIGEGFRVAGGNFDSGRELPALFSQAGLEARVEAHVVALPPGHPYLRLPLQFANALRPRLEKLVGAQELDALLGRVESELARPGTWGTTFTLVQAWAETPR